MVKRLFFIMCSLAVICSCTAEMEFHDGEVCEDSSFQLEPGAVAMELPSVSFEDEAVKTMVSVDEISGLKFRWAEGDAVGVYAEEGGFSRFSLTEGAGTSTALFDGQGFKLTEGKTYRALYPYGSDDVDPTSIAMDYSSFSVSGDNKSEDLIPFDPLYASATVDGTGAACFSFGHVSSFARLKCTMPSDGTFTRLDLLPTYGGLVKGGSFNIVTGEWTPDGSDVVRKIRMNDVDASSAGQELTLWIPLAPQALKNSDMAAIIYDSQGNAYTSRLKGKNFSSGSAYRWDVSMPSFEVMPAGSFSLTQMKVNNLSNMPSGQYSGITHIGGTRYAVVHDTAKGGGIYFFDLTFGNDGSISACSCSIPGGTSSAADTRDPEGVAYYPVSNTLFVSGERDQSILEYALDGVPTGRALAVPDDMSGSGIIGNSGFESLDYNAATGKFWTTTEMSLKKDTSYADLGGKLLRLQSFSSDLTASDRFFYVLDKPQKSSSDARNYAFGVPDILAMDDGKLLIIEREAFIPNGNYMEILFNTAVYMKIYEVDPAHDNGGVLSKKLVTSFAFTGAFNYANYEGICFGPVLNGKQTVLMISDSQDRYSGVLQDLLMVLSISGQDADS